MVFPNVDVSSESASDSYWSVSVRSSAETAFRQGRAQSPCYGSEGEVAADQLRRLIQIEMASVIRYCDVLTRITCMKADRDARDACAGRCRCRRGCLRGWSRSRRRRMVVLGNKSVRASLKRVGRDSSRTPVCPFPTPCLCVSGCNRGNLMVDALDGIGDMI